MKRFFIALATLFLQFTLDAEQITLTLLFKDRGKEVAKTTVSIDTDKPGILKSPLIESFINLDIENKNPTYILENIRLKSPQNIGTFASLLGAQTEGVVNSMLQRLSPVQVYDVTILADYFDIQNDYMFANKVFDKLLEDASLIERWGLWGAEQGFNKQNPIYNILVQNKDSIAENNKEIFFQEIKTQRSWDDILTDEVYFRIPRSEIDRFYIRVYRPTLDEVLLKLMERYRLVEELARPGDVSGMF